MCLAVTQLIFLLHPTYLSTGAFPLLRKFYVWKENRGDVCKVARERKNWKGFSFNVNVPKYARKSYATVDLNQIM